MIDALIAATARVHGVTVVTRNVKDFELAGVQVLNPSLSKPSERRGAVRDHWNISTANDLAGTARLLTSGSCSSVNSWRLACG